jgi:hypothetical protein
MSWSIDVTGAEQEGLYELLEVQAEKKVADSAQHSNADALDEMVQQMSAATEAAVILAKTTGVRQVNVHLSGHANPGHEPREGYGDDSVTVSVIQTSS